MNRREAEIALADLSVSPAAAWIGNRVVDGRLNKRCMRCGVEETFGIALPPRGAAPRDPPDGLDEALFSWMRAFQLAHEGCVEGTGADAGALPRGQEASAVPRVAPPVSLTRVLSCATHGVRRSQGHVMCEWCGQTYRTAHGGRSGNAPDVCRCGQRLLPPVEARIGDALGLQVEGVAIDGDGRSHETSEASAWTARPICYLCHRRLLKEHGGRMPIERDCN